MNRCAMNKWIQVSDKMPNDQDSILLMSSVGHDMLVEAWYDDTSDEWVCFDDKFSLPISADDQWMELSEVGE